MRGQIGLGPYQATRERPDLQTLPHIYTHFTVGTGNNNWVEMCIPVAFVTIDLKEVKKVNRNLNATTAVQPQNGVFPARLQRLTLLSLLSLHTSPKAQTASGK